MTKETARLVHFKGRKRVLEERLEKLANEGTIDEFIEVGRELDTIDHRIQVAENFLEEGFKTSVKETYTVTSSVRPYAH
ncbi:MAG: hypothetical protein KAR19_03635 [Bacteroidales bacterium]|nr:hypothetical protein [Bacteroidales bacterium]